MILSNISSFVFIRTHFKTDLTSSLYAGLQSAGLTQSIYSLVAAFVLRKKIQDIFATFQTFYDSCKTVVFVQCPIRIKISL